MKPNLFILRPKPITARKEPLLKIVTFFVLALLTFASYFVYLLALFAHR